MYHNYFVYIVECADKSYYTGITNDVDGRVDEHNAGLHERSYTYSRRPVTLKYFERFQDVSQAIDFEKQVKGWTRKKKEALFVENWEEVKRLANLKGSPKLLSLRSVLRQAQDDSKKHCHAEPVEALNEIFIREEK